MTILPHHIRAACYDRLALMVSAGTFPEDFNIFAHAAVLAEKYAAEPDESRAHEILSRGAGTTAEEIWASGSEVVAFIREGTLPPVPAGAPYVA